MWIYLPENYESCRFSPGTGGTASVSGLPVSIPGQSAMSRKTPTPSRSYSSDSKMSHPPSIPLQSGMTSRPSIPDRGEDTLISLPPDSPANPIPKLGTARSLKDSTIPETSGPRHLNAFGWWDVSTSCLRTWQRYWPEMEDGKPTLAPYSETLPRWGSVTSDGEFIQRQMLAAPIFGEDSGSWHIPTPTAADVYTGKMKSSQQSEGSMHSVSLPDYVARRWATPTAQDHKDIGKNTNYHRLAKKSMLAGQAVIQGQNTEASLNPAWVERYLMSLPEGWTMLEPLSGGAYDKWWQGMKDKTWWDSDPGDIPEADGGIPRITTGIKDRVNRLKCLGNGVVPASGALAFITLEGE